MRIEIHTPQDGARQPDPPGSPRASRAAPSAFVQALEGASEVVASCALWSDGLPTLGAGGGTRLGFIGRFDCLNGAAAGAALEAACGWLASKGCQLAVGPLDGSTWHRYRLVTESSPEPAFHMEPTNPAEWPAFWTSARFTPLASYHSAINEHLESHDQRLSDASAHARAAGLTVRPLNMARFDDELRAIFELSLNAFAGNFLYSPIEWSEFSGMYAGMKDALDPRLVLVCDDPSRPGKLVGYIMAFPDLLEHRRNGVCRTVILKSMAVHTQWRSVRLGTWLVAQAQASARALGMSRSIFALMHDANPSARISRHYARVIRRYTLFARELAT